MFALMFEIHHADLILDQAYNPLMAQRGTSSMRHDNQERQQQIDKPLG
ncbi:hypothetical protein LT85_2844 [Collimonas arenae]|uniref:Uncharacterized protein n=1 Tax=Collimonas arenae TaxID=279058 RepID=A0A0A1FGH6_9BURK|nr:hypothetical protein LT85_2844 [Collimonas arenae]